MIKEKAIFTEPYSKFCEMILKKFCDVHELFAHKVMNFKFRVKNPYIKFTLQNLSIWNSWSLFSNGRTRSLLFWLSVKNSICFKFMPRLHNAEWAQCWNCDKFLFAKYLCCVISVLQVHNIKDHSAVSYYSHSYN